MKPVRIANAGGFWGDQIGAAARLLAQEPDLDYLTLDYLAEVSLSIMAIQREQNPQLGYARDFVEVVRSLIPFWQAGSRVKVVANAGGLNPQACAQACSEILRQAGLERLKIAIVTGDDVLLILQMNSSSLFAHLDTGEPIDRVRNRLVTANAYLGAQPIAEALRKQADLVITGRVADPSLTVGPCIAHFNWPEKAWDQLAGATLAGHLIECGTQLTGGISTHWLQLEDPAHLGFPIAEVSSDGSCVVTKPSQSSGEVSLRTVKEQLLYEMGDPSAYLSPDVTLSILGVELELVDLHRVSVTGARGAPPPPTLKVSATYRDGYRAEGYLTLFGLNVREKAQRCGEVILARVQEAGYSLARTQIEVLGAGDSVKGLLPPPDGLYEAVLRVSVADPNKEAVERFTEQFAPLVTSGPQGVTGYASGRPPVRPVFGYWPCLIEATHIYPQVR